MQRTNQTHSLHIYISFAKPANVREWCANVFTWMPCCFSHFKNIHCLILNNISHWKLHIIVFVARCSFSCFHCNWPSIVCVVHRFIVPCKMYVGNDYLTELPQYNATRQLKTQNWKIEHFFVIHWQLFFGFIWSHTIIIDCKQTNKKEKLWIFCLTASFNEAVNIRRHETNNYKLTGRIHVFPFLFHFKAEWRVICWYFNISIERCNVQIFAYPS